ncbi:type II toxin-antitoxin system prevent-host-death family antitoxin [Phreatobacter sp.]|uniref:type II toxin-antitoxin system Phd/YefM family antitoxin n=1 Tax=Phreatobacter sp. TaxID=1966341 RepID=UPI0022CC7D30|nr:type II toxin-antitoxin system prevent-host-death family antitoxin [Phreatobacter sp.]MCZ8314463.1 type II toxin-antitoxin system prevent-host-death family antitoxin [Phreatobacter sp.]
MKVGILEAKNQFSALAERAFAGEEVIVTKRGEPFVQIVPVQRRHDPEEIKAAFRRVRDRMREEGVSLTQDEVRELRDEGHR